MNNLQDRVLHVRFAGRSFDLPLRSLDLGPAALDSEIKAAAARRLDVSVRDFTDYVVDRHATGNLTIRPEAVFG